MIKYGIKEFIRNIYSNIFIAVQLAVTLIIAIASVSSVLSRTELYAPVEDFIDGNGYFIDSLFDSAELNSALEEIEEIKNTYSALDTNMFYSIENNNELTEVDESCKYVSALTDDYIKAYTPHMKSGVWLDDYTAGDKDELFAVATENDYYKTGDTVTAAYKYRVGKMSPSDENYDEYDPYKYEYKQFKIKIIGVVEDNSKILGFNKGIFVADGVDVENSSDFRELYTTVNKYVDFMLIMPEKVIKNTGCEVYPSGNRIVTLKDGTSDDRNLEIMRYLRQYGIVTELDEFRDNTVIYINGQLIKLIPFLICTMILVVVSSVSISALNAKKRIKYFGILYICGSRWKGCLYVNLVNNLITAFMSGVVTYVIIKMLEITDILTTTVISMGLWQFVACLVIIIIYLVCSFVMPIVIMSRNTPKEILTSSE